MKWQCVRISQYAYYFNYGKEKFWLEYSQGALPHLPPVNYQNGWRSGPLITETDDGEVTPLLQTSIKAF